MSDGVMTYEDWLRGCVHHDGRHGYVTLPCDEVLKIADFIERLRHSQHIQDVASVGCVDRKTESDSEKPNNCEDLQDWKDRMWTEAMRSCGFNVDDYRQGQPKTEPQTERSE